jgi:hypothetical protein
LDDGEVPIEELIANIEPNHNSFKELSFLKMESRLQNNSISDYKQAQVARQIILICFWIIFRLSKS